MIKTNQKLKFEIIFLFILVLSALFYSGFVLATPTGATINITKTDSYSGSGGSTNISAFAGNITEINIYGVSTTQVWQGFYGNVSGGFKLSDSLNNVFYNWSTVIPLGEVYSSRNESVIWSNIQCFNFTAMGNYSDDSENKGKTSLYGMNITQLESSYNISLDDVDGVDETFNLKNHQLFYTNSLQFDPGECPNTKMWNSSGEGGFEEVLLYSPDNKEIVFTSIIKHAELGFDNAAHDFEMLVLSDNHGTKVETTPYYFYLEMG